MPPKKDKAKSVKKKVVNQVIQVIAKQRENNQKKQQQKNEKNTKVKENKTSGKNLRIQMKANRKDKLTKPEKKE